MQSWTNVKAFKAAKANNQEIKTIWWAVKPMEDKLDKLSEAVVEMARMEERLLTVFKRLQHMDAAFKKYDDRVDEIEKQAHKGTENSLWTLFWMSSLAPLV